MKRGNTMAVIVSFFSAMFLLGGQVIAQSTFSSKSISPVSGDQGWLYYGGDQGGRHFSGNTQINKKNVKDLDVAWTHRSGDVETFGNAMENTSTQSTPILLPVAAGESLIYCTPFGRVIALDPGNGKQRWQFDPKVDQKRHPYFSLPRCQLWPNA